MRLLHIVKKNAEKNWLPYHMLFNTFRRLRDKIVKKLRSSKSLLGLLEYYLHIFLTLQVRKPHDDCVFK